MPLLPVTCDVLDVDINWDLAPADADVADADPLTAALIDSLSYRLIAHEALDLLHLMTRLASEREQHVQLLNEYRFLREKVMREAAR